MTAWSFPRIDSFESISLDETRQIAYLQVRIDRKYLIEREFLASIAYELTMDYRALEVNGDRRFQYETAYFDTSEMLLYRSHLQGRRRRFKVRSRRYMHTGDCVFELKYKDGHGQTLKEKIDYPWWHHGQVNEAARSFVASTAFQRCGIVVTDQLLRALDVNFTRVTLVNPRGPDRITCDYDLSFRRDRDLKTRLGNRFLILETKGSFGLSVADRLLKARGQRPISCSKYCVGVGAANPRIKNNPYRPLLRRYFNSLEPTWSEHTPSN